MYKCIINLKNSKDVLTNGWTEMMLGQIVHPCLQFITLHLIQAPTTVKQLT